MKVLSLSQIKKLYDDLRDRITAKYTKPANGIPATDLANDIAKDVQINGTSIVTDGVANVPIATSDSGVPGVVMVNTFNGLYMNGGVISINSAFGTDFKTATNVYKPVTPGRQHESVFYGLAKASGDSTQSSSANAVGTYTESAKSAIASMLNAPETVSGSTPTINAKAGVRYVCGEVSTLTIVVPASGIIDVTFESGSTATVLTVTPPTGITMKWADEFDPTSLESNTVYAIRIVDGEYASAIKWGVSNHPAQNGDYFELIETITLTEETNQIVRNQTPNNTPYGFKSIIMMVDAPAYSKAVDTKVSISGSYGGLFQLTLWSNTINTSARKSFITLENIGVNLFKSFRNSGQQWGYTSGTCELATNVYSNNQTDEIRQISFGANNTTNMIPSGTVIKIYGVWA